MADRSIEMLGVREIDSLVFVTALERGRGIGERTSSLSDAPA